MDESAEKKGAEELMANGTDQGERRSVRRRLVESTLFPHKSPEIEPKIDQKANEGEDDNNDGEDEDFCGSQGKKKGRKRKGKVTPQNRASKKAKEKSPMKTTPKKNGMNNSGDCENASLPRIPNLRLEAKLTAEENSRMFAGKQIHPFFASWKAGKRKHETAEIGSNTCLPDRSNKAINIGPIHVFERTQDDVVLDWKDWTFFEKTSIDTGCNLEGLFTSVFESCVLCLDNFPLVSHSSDPSFVQNELSDQCLIQDNDFLGTSMAIPAVLVDEQLENCQPLKRLEGDYKVDEVAVLSKQADNVENSEFEQQSKLLQERFVSCYHGCSIQPDNSLWTDKYQPKCATESGKSAAIQACAKEQGFKVLESNASDCRNGAVVKQKFGEGLESCCLTGSVENPIDSLSKHVMKSAGPLSDGEAVQELDDKLIELITISDKEDTFGAHGASENHACNDSEIGFGQAKLILFEDVDISFPEDRGFVAAIQHIAGKAEGPVILTSNS